MTAPLNSYQFPGNFVWDVATSSYQIESAVAEGGRQPTVWDTFSSTPGRILNDNKEVTC